MTDGKERKNRRAAEWILLLLLSGLLLCGLSGCTGLNAAEAIRQLTSFRQHESCREELVRSVQELAEKIEPYAPDTEREKARIPDVYQVLLIGSDRRDDGWNGNSDTMLLLSVNRNKKTVSLISFMRDLGVEIPGVGYGKLNSAYAKGGSSLLIQTLEQDFQIEIDNYVSVDFDGMERIVDLFGGVTLDVSEAELPAVNDAIRASCSAEGIDPGPYLLSAPGTAHLNGKQALSYSRNRSVGRWDFDRTARQRRVLEQLIGSAKNMDIAQLLAISAQVIPLVSHDLSAQRLSALIAMVPSLKDYSLVMDRIPYDDLYVSNGENLDPVWGETVARLHASLY